VPRMKNEYVLYATRIGDEDWQEALITTADVTPEGLAKLEKAKVWAKSNGFDRIRVTTFMPGEKPDFSKAVKR
jgi:hypothetical protein